MRQGLMGKILMVVLIPLVAIALIITVYSSVVLKNVLDDSVENELKIAAFALLENYGQHPGDYSIDDEGILRKGTDLIVSDNTATLDNLLNNSDISSTFFYGRQRVATTILDSEGNRYISGNVSDKVAVKVLEEKKNYLESNDEIDGIKYINYYIPVYQESDPNQIVGIISAGYPKALVSQELMTNILVSSIVSLVMLVCAAIVSTTVCIHIINAIKRTVSALNKVAEGDLRDLCSEKDLARKDEIGDIIRATLRLQKNLGKFIGKINQTVVTLHLAATRLDATVEQTNVTTDEVARAIEDISAGATAQATETQGATDHVIDIGTMIQGTRDKVVSLNENAEQMRKISKEAMDILEELYATNEKTKDAAKIIADQTSITNESALKINEATTLIASIADETNLLALNASIEAARAGEHGRGFAVVAAQIQKLAEQSNESTNLIEKIISRLLHDTRKAVATMEDVKGVIGEQSNNMDKTKQMFKAVNEGIGLSIDGVSAIADKMHELNKAKRMVVDIVQNLTAIAEENAASTQETSASVEELTATMSAIAGSASSLNDLAEGLQNEIEIFKL